MMNPTLRIRIVPKAMIPVILMPVSMIVKVLTWWTTTIPVPKKRIIQMEAKRKAAVNQNRFPGKTTDLFSVIPGEQIRLDLCILGKPLLELVDLAILGKEVLWVFDRCIQGKAVQRVVGRCILGKEVLQVVDRCILVKPVRLVVSRYILGKPVLLVVDRCILAKAILLVVDRWILVKPVLAILLLVVDPTARKKILLTTVGLLLVDRTSQDETVHLAVDQSTRKETRPRRIREGATVRLKPMGLQLKGQEGVCLNIQDARLFHKQSHHLVVTRPSQILNANYLWKLHLVFFLRARTLPRDQPLRVPKGVVPPLLRTFTPIIKQRARPPWDLSMFLVHHA
jgi:hypothetical protein